ncbi:synaptogyrin-2 isoform X2 [Sorex fumeus]|uniref:synaptogyrin-2 isoform X2 n=1 Tax=Sorex fumeus TaxID=62283 RepID=UPI0024AE1226|nr:synaptogyrin-2 isoform X2 [Sorex fumeus]
MDSGAYGAAKAGGAFDLRRFVAQPQVVARAVCLLFALIEFSCIFGEGYSNTHDGGQEYCVFNRNEDACRYGSAIGVLAFLACAGFLVVDAYFPQISNATDRKYLVVADLLFSGCARLAGLPALQGRCGRLHGELRGPQPRARHGLRILPWGFRGQLPAASLHPDGRRHRGLPAAPRVLSAPPLLRAFLKGLSPECPATATPAPTAPRVP